jgi:hypothetical protein
VLNLIEKEIIEWEDDAPLAFFYEPFLSQFVIEVSTIFFSLFFSLHSFDFKIHTLFLMK